MCAAALEQATRQPMGDRADPAQAVAQRKPTSDTTRLSTRARALFSLLRLPAKDRAQFFESYTAFSTDDAVCDLSDFDAKHPLVPLLNGGDPRIVSYYNVLNLICALGSVEKMYIPPVLDESASLRSNQLLFEKRMADDLGLGPYTRVLELGCGRGRISANLASTTGASVTGINIDPSQIAEADAWARRTGLEAQLSFLTLDFNEKWPFADASFDAVYAIQPLTYSVSLLHIFSEAFRVVKPGGKVAILDCVLLDGFSRHKPEHMRLISPTRQLLGMGGAWHVGYWEAALREAGFSLEASRDLSLNQTQTPLIRRAEKSYRHVSALVGLCALLGASYMKALMKRFAKHTEDFVRMDQQGLLTTSWYMLATRPARTSPSSDEADMQA